VSEISESGGAREGHGMFGPFARVPGAVLGIVTTVTLFAMMVLTFVDVFGRYLFNSPVYGGYEIVEIMMGVLIFSALPLLCAREGHVTIDILDGVTPRGAAYVQRIVVNLVSAVALAAVAWQLYAKSFDLAKNNEVWMTLKIRHAPFAIGFAALAALGTVACLANCVLYLLGKRDPKQSEL
jgi:TRAP-type transport system small permease protein